MCYVLTLSQQGIYPEFVFFSSSSLICCTRTQEGQLPLKSHFKTVADRENVGWPLKGAEAPQTCP